MKNQDNCSIPKLSQVVTNWWSQGSISGQKSGWMDGLREWAARSPAGGQSSKAPQCQYESQYCSTSSLITCKVRQNGPSAQIMQVLDTPEGCVAIQRKPDRLEKRAKSDLLKFNKGQLQSPGRNNPMHICKKRPAVNKLARSQQRAVTAKKAQSNKDWLGRVSSADLWRWSFLSTQDWQAFLNAVPSSWAPKFNTAYWSKSCKRSWRQL